MAKTEREAELVVCLQRLGEPKGTPRHCIGSKCMAWDWLYPRWGKELESRAVEDVGRTEPAGDDWRMERGEAGASHWVRRERIKVGDCGLKASMGPELQL